MTEPTPQIVPPVSASELEAVAVDVDKTVKDTETVVKSVKQSGVKGLFGAIAGAVNGNQPVIATIAAGAASTFGLHLPATEVAYVVAAVAAVATWIEKF